MIDVSLAGISHSGAGLREPQRGGMAFSGLSRDLERVATRIGVRLRRPPRVVLMGEFNSGKSTLANALIGADVLPTSVLANSRIPILVHYSPAPTIRFEGHDRVSRPLTLATLDDVRQGQARMLEVGLPVERLKRFELIDTPGLATGAARLDDMVMDACRRSNIAVWCTVATQAWKASECSIWAAVPDRLRQRSILAVTHIDALNCERDRDRLEQRVEKEAAPRFSAHTMIAASLADQISRSPQSIDYQTSWAACGGEAIDSALGSMIEREMTTRQNSAERLLARASARQAVSHL